ncbi:hypothetical protein ALQ78_101638 [Pseudomonas syringae pv. aptata]|nr:hypothetical protein ALO65_102181 [Pseudomonas syringae pv. papulans]RMM46296.1 hypothetical protein ALQ78_101638 [Pseudomonas syringae pv. aptata]RMN47463.1 hypothetical protein ALQ60_102058 [Pseudomonas syringae pv. papulans]RMV37390.1 hypothetical protein ALP11_102523 [Pseudomonas syringae pv. papulans]
MVNVCRDQSFNAFAFSGGGKTSTTQLAALFAPQSTAELGNLISQLKAINRL